MSAGTTPDTDVPARRGIFSGQMSKTWIFGLLAFFSIGVPRVVIQSAASSTFLTYHSASSLAYIYLLVAALIPLTTVLFLAMEARLSKFRLLVGLECLRVAVALLLRAALGTEYAPQVAYVGIVWAETEFVLGSLVFWGLAGQCFAVSESKRDYPRIAGGEQVGALVGGALIPVAMVWTAPAGLLWASAASLGVSILIIGFLSTRFPHLRHGARAAAAHVARTSERSPPFNGLMRSYLTFILAAAMLANLSFYLIDNLFYHESERHFADPRAMASFFGIMFSFANGATLVFSLAAAPRLLARFGVGMAVSWLPAAMCLMGLCLIAATLVPGIPAFAVFVLAAAMKLADEGLRVAVYRPAFQVLYQPIPPLQRVRALARTEGLAEPAGIAFAGILVLAIGQSHLGSAALAGVALAGFATWLAVTGKIRILYVGALNLAVSRRQHIDLDASALNTREARRLVLAKLRGGTESDAIAALEILQKLNRKHFLAAAAGLLRTGGSAVIGQILATLTKAELPEFLPVLRQRLSGEREPATRASIIAAIGKIDDARITPLLSAAVTAMGPQREMAYAGLVAHDRGAATVRAVRDLKTMAASPDAGDRKLFLRTVSRSGSGRFDQDVVGLFNDADDRVKRLAFLVAGRSGRPEFIEPIADYLDADDDIGRSRDTAGRALGDLGLPATSTLGSLLASSTHSRARVLAAEGLARIGGPGAERYLFDHLFVDDAATAKAAAVGLWRTRRRLDGATQRKARHRIRSLLLDCAEAGQAVRDIDPLEGSSLLVAALRHRAHERLAHAFVLAALVNPAASVDIAPLLSTRLQTDQKLYLAELADSLMPRGLRPLCALLSIAEPSPDQVTRLAALAQAEHMSPVQRLTAVALDESQSAWARSCALALAAAQNVEGASGLLARTMALSGLVGETSRRLVAGDNQGEAAMPLSTIEKVLALKKADLFAPIPDEYLASFAPVMTSLHCEAGQIIMQEGDPGDCLYIVVSGELDVTRNGKAAATLGPNAVVGDLAALDPQPRSATVSARTEAHLLMLTNDHLESLIASHADISQGIIRVLCSRLRDALAV